MKRGDIFVLTHGEEFAQHGCFTWTTDKTLQEVQEELAEERPRVWIGDWLQKKGYISLVTENELWTDYNNPWRYSGGN